MVVVTDAPVCSISGASAVCAGSTGNSYDGPAGMDSYAWSIVGNGTIAGAANGQTVDVTALGAGNYTLMLTVTDNGCTSTCTETVLVNANPLCSITGADAPF